jgi:hypothetical protein
MTIVTCCGDQDRNTKASETHPNRPPNDTRNCYTRNSFDWDTCGTQDEKACFGHGGCDACVADDIGGYCDDNGKIFVSRGSRFEELKGTQLIDRFRDGSSGREDDIRLRREERDMERRMENKIREMQIMGQDPLPKITTTNTSPHKTPTTQSFIASYFNIIGLGLGILLVLISVALGYMKKSKTLQ